MTLSIVILSYNTKDLLTACVKSLEKNFVNELENSDVEIILVDNASEKETVEGIRRYFAGKNYVLLIESKENLGFGRGCNLGLEKSKGDFVLFLNSDTQVEDRGLMEMVSFLRENSKVGILGGKLTNFDGTPQPSAGSFYNIANFFIMLFGGEKYGLLRSSPSKIQKVDWVSGACMMVNKNLFDKVGKFDKNLFMYMEDMELCFRAKKQGVLTYFYPNVSVKHKEQGSSNRTFAVLNIYKGLLYFFSKHKSKAEYHVVRFSLFSKAIAVYLLGKATNNNYYTKTYGEALKVFR